VALFLKYFDLITLTPMSFSFVLIYYYSSKVTVLEMVRTVVE